MFCRLATYGLYRAVTRTNLPKECILFKHDHLQSPHPDPDPNIDQFSFANVIHRECFH